MKKIALDLIKELGFSDKDGRVYTALLEHGALKASDISKITGLNRTTVYDLLDQFTQKGLVSKFKKKSATYFNAHDPAQLLNYLDREKDAVGQKIERQKKRIEAMMPELVSLMNFSKKSRPRVQFFEGEKGMREAYEDTLTAKEPILAFANLETMKQGLPGFFPDYFERRVAKKLAIRSVFPRNKESFEQATRNQEELRETRYLPDESMTFTPEVNFYDNKMLIVSWTEKMAVIIESKELVDLMKLAYNLLWGALPKS